LDIRPLSEKIPNISEGMLEFFSALEESGALKYFHPHPFTPEHISKLLTQPRADYYAVMLEGDAVVGYGMLRGWDDGYDVPSLGIGIHPLHHRKGYGRTMMQHLHHEAAKRGASKVRLRVYESNTRAVSLYKDLGYVFSKDTDDDTKLVGIIDIYEYSLLCLVNDRGSLARKVIL